jgi:DNA-binding NarL/FixJ family response regulator
LIALPRARRGPELRLALVHDGARRLTAVSSILAVDGLQPNAGVVEIRRVHVLARATPEVIVLACDLGRPQSLSAVRWLQCNAPDARVVVVARDPSGALARQALNVGAAAFVAEQDADTSLAAAVLAVVAGLVCAPRVNRRLVAKPTFSHREKQVLGLLVTGLTNRQIAGRLYLAESTVKTHVTSALRKLGVRSRQDAAAVLLDPAEGLLATALPAGDAARGLPATVRLAAPPPPTGATAP